MLLDSTRAAYESYGLQTSIARSWGPKNLLYYAKALLQGRKLQPKRGDTDQLGGNFIVDHSGVLQLAYRSKYPTDRPEIDELLAICRTIAEKR